MGGEGVMGAEGGKGGGLGGYNERKREEGGLSGGMDDRCMAGRMEGWGAVGQ